MSNDVATDHVTDTVEHLAQLSRDLDKAIRATLWLANATTRLLGRAGVVVSIVGLVVLWIAGNVIAEGLGLTPIEKFSFEGLEFIATISAFLLALIILSTQRHEDERATKRSQLTLQIAVLSEKKVAKVIALLEEARRESPILASRIDKEAEAMAEAADPRSNLEQIEAARTPATEDDADAATAYTQSRIYGMSNQ